MSTEKPLDLFQVAIDEFHDACMELGSDAVYGAPLAKAEEAVRVKREALMAAIEARYRRPVESVPAPAGLDGRAAYDEWYNREILFGNGAVSREVGWRAWQARASLSPAPAPAGLDLAVEVEPWGNGRFAALHVRAGDLGGFDVAAPREIIEEAGRRLRASLSPRPATGAREEEPSDGSPTAERTELQKELGDFGYDLMHLLNRYSIDNSCETPDFILAQFVMGVLDRFRITTGQRESYFGRANKICPETLE